MTALDGQELGGVDTDTVPPMSHTTLRALDLLHDASARAPDRVRERLHDVRALFGDDLDAVERRLARLVRDGVSPGVESAVHLFEGGGKRVRPLTVILSAACFGVPTPAARAVAVAAELVHLATLLHDDVIDDGRERRGRPTSRCLWGNAVSVLAGDLLLTHALEVTAEGAPPSVLADLLSTLRRLVDGEVVQLRGRTELDTSEESYFRIARDKTASLFEWAARSGATCAHAPAEAVAALGEFGVHVGLAFQLVDDVLDYAGDPRATGKTLFGDLAEGKLTLPLIRALSAAPALTEHVDAVRSGDQHAAFALVEAVRASGACDGVRALAREETALAVRSLEVVPASVARQILETIAKDLASRIA